MIEIPKSVTFFPAENGKKDEIDCRTGIPGKKITCVQLNVAYNNYGDTTSPRSYYRNTLFIDFSAFKGGSTQARAIIPVASSGGTFPDDVIIAAIDEALHLMPEDESWKFEAITYIKLRVDEDQSRVSVGSTTTEGKDYTLLKNIPE